MPILKRKIKGISCFDCSNHAIEDIKKINGVKDAKIDFLQEIISIEILNDVNFDSIEPRIEAILSIMK